MRYTHESYTKLIKDKLKIANVKLACDGNAFRLYHVSNYRDFACYVIMNDFVIELRCREQNNEYIGCLNFHSLDRHCNLRKSIAKKFGYKESDTYFSKYACNIILPESIMFNDIDNKTNNIKISLMKYNAGDLELHELFLGIDEERSNAEFFYDDLCGTKGYCGIEFENINGFDKVIELFKKVVTNITSYLLEITDANENDYSDGLDDA